MATHSIILARRIPMDRGAWQATVHGAARVGHNLVTKPGQRLKMENNNLRTSGRRLPSF